MKACYADGGVADLVPLRVLRGSEEVRQFFAGLFAAVPDLETTYELAAASGDTAVIEYRARGTFNGAAFEGIEPTGRRVEIRGCDVMRIENDRIAHNTAYYDGMEFARQIGMMPPQDSAAERVMTGAFNAVTKLRARLSQR